MKISDLIERKKELGYTNEMISEKSGVPLSTVNKIFGGITEKPRYNTLQSIQCVLFPEQYTKKEAALYKDIAENLALDWGDRVSEGYALDEYMGTSSKEEVIRKYEEVISWKKAGEITVDDIENIPDGMFIELIEDMSRIQERVNEANKEHVQCIENARINEADVSQKICRKVVAKHASSEITFSAKAFVLATGGIYGGGIDLTPNQCTEKIFSLPIVVQPTELTESDIFAEHNFSKIGVVVNERLCPQNPRGETVLENVFLAGKILAGFDQSAEKSGHGVAIATGYQAGILAGNYAQEATRRA